jgi:hypothetical protein
MPALASKYPFPRVHRLHLTLRHIDLQFRALCSHLSLYLRTHKMLSAF